MTENLYLAHHGVKGMKWGVRRTPEQLGHPTVSRKEARAQYKQEVRSARMDRDNERSRLTDRYKSEKARNEAKYQKSLTDKERAYLARKALIDETENRAAANKRDATTDADRNKHTQWENVASAANVANDIFSYKQASSVEAKQAVRDKANSAAYNRWARGHQEATRAYKAVKTQSKAKYRISTNRGKAKFYDSKAVKQALSQYAKEVAEFDALDRMER